jgi:hypothetical protein
LYGFTTESERRRPGDCPAVVLARRAEGETPSGTAGKMPALLVFNVVIIIRSR